MNIFNKKWILVLFYIVTLQFSSSTAFAWENDVHEATTYIVFRAFGWSHEAALLIAKGSQRVDESKWSTPMPNDPHFLDKSASSHFIANELQNPPTADAHGNIVSGVMGSIIKMFGLNYKMAIAKKDAALGYYMLWKGALTGDLMMISAGVHHLEDVHSDHTGNSSIIGHGNQAHLPDATELHTQKYKDTIFAVARVASKLKWLLPKKYIDNESALKYLNSLNQKKVYDESVFLDHNEVAAAILEDSKLVNVFRTRTEALKSYKLVALTRFYNHYNEIGAFNRALSFDELFPSRLVNSDLYTFEDIIKNLIYKTKYDTYLHIQNKDGVEIPIFKDISAFFKDGTKDGATKEEMDNKLNNEIDRYRKEIEKYASARNRVTKAWNELSKPISELTLFYVLLIDSHTHGKIRDELKTQLESYMKAYQSINEITLLEKDIDFELNLREQIKMTDQMNAELIAFHEKMRAPQLNYFNQKKDLIDIQARLFSNAPVKSYDLLNSKEMEDLAVKLGTESYLSEIANTMAIKFIPTINGDSSKFAVEGDDSGNRILFLWTKKNRWRNYINQAWGQNFVSLEESSPGKIESAKIFFKTLFKMKIEMPEIPDTTPYLKMTDRELALLVAKGNDAAALALAERDEARYSPYDSTTKMSEAKVARFQLAYLRLFDTMMMEYLKSFMKAGFFSSVKKWDQMLSVSKKYAKAAFYEPISRWVDGNIESVMKGDKLREFNNPLRPSHLSPAKQYAIEHELENLKKTTGSVRPKDSNISLRCEKIFN